MKEGIIPKILIDASLNNKPGVPYQGPYFVVFHSNFSGRHTDTHLEEALKPEPGGKTAMLDGYRVGSSPIASMPIGPQVHRPHEGHSRGRELKGREHIFQVYSRADGRPLNVDPGSAGSVQDDLKSME